MEPSKIVSFGIILAFSFSVGAQESAEVPAVSSEVVTSLIHSYFWFVAF